jgi:glycosyltransferase involved in cell wall biosynthesis
VERGGAPAEVYLSVVVPFYNEEGNLQALVDEVEAGLEGLNESWDLVLVDDGSTDRGGELVRDLARSRPWLRLLQLDANHGQSEALIAGIRAARGEIIAVLDADRQSSPADIPKMLEMIGPYDFVSGYRLRRKDSWSRRLISWLANTTMRVLGVRAVRDAGCPLKVFKKSCLDRVPFFRGAHRFVATLAAMGGARIVDVPVSHFPRRAGRSHYGIWDRLRVVPFDLLALRWLSSRRLRHVVSEEAPREDVKTE